MRVLEDDGGGARNLSWSFCVLGAAALAMLWFVTLGNSILTEPDEARYAEIPREMLVSGDWVTPRLDGIVYFEKPPLQYWITALGYATFGVQPWVSKLWTWLSSFLGILVAAFAGARLFNWRVGLLAGLVLASSPLYFVVGHLNTLDSGLTLFMGAALAAFLLAKSPAEGTRQRRLWMLAAWIATAMAVLSKGPVAVFIPLASLVCYVLVTRDRSVLRALEPVAGGMLFILICAPWFILVARRNPDFTRFFFVHEHVTRFLTSEHGRIKPWWFFPILLVFGLVPWTGTVSQAWYRALRERAGQAFSIEKFLAIYAAVVLVFFSLSGSKLAPYLDPIVPPLALLAAASIERQPREQARMIRVFTWLGAALLVAAVPVMTVKLRGSPEFQESQHFTPWLFATAATWCVGAGLAMALAERRRIYSSAVAVAAGLILGLQLTMSGLREFSATRSAEPVVKALRTQVGTGTTIYSIGGYLQGIPFDLKRTVTVVGQQGDLEVQLEPQSRNWVPSMRDFAERWNRELHPVAVIDRQAWKYVEPLGLPMETFYADDQTVLIRKDTRLSKAAGAGRGD